jgi:PEP-CTERM motif
MGVFEAPGVGNTDAWDGGPLPPPGGAIHYSVTPADTAGHPSYLGFSPADIFISPAIPGYSTPGAPVVYAGFAALGLVAPGDDIDALAIIEDGVPGFTAGDTVYFSLTPISPTLGILGASPADILVTTLAGIPAVAFPAASLGLFGIAAAPDDIDALHLFVVPEPSTFLLGAVGFVGLGWLARRRRRRA